MARLCFPDEMSTSEPTDTGWSCWRPPLDGIVEVGTLRGSDVGLPTHFHRENQIVKVYQGEFDPLSLLNDAQVIPDTPAGFRDKALPFAGRTMAKSRSLVHHFNAL